MLELLAVGDSDRLLDLGTGTGGVLRELGHRSAPTVGVDPEPRMLARAAAAAPPGVELVEAEAGALPFPDRSFDRVTCAYLLHLLGPEDRAEVLAEAGRVLAPGGRLATVTVAPPAGRLARLAGAPVRALAWRSQGVLAGLRPLDPGPDLRAAGFLVEATRRVARGWPSLCVVARPARG